MLRDLPYQQLVENLTSAIMVLDEANRIQFANAASEVLLDASVKRLISFRATVLFANRVEETELLELVRNTGQPYSKREAELTTLSGRKITVDYTITSLPDSRLLIEAFSRDRLLRIEREEELLNHHATARSLVRGLAHEIKNPLGGIRGAAQLLDRELASDEQKEYTRIIIEETDRLRNLVDRLMGPYRKPQIEKINIHAVLEHVRSLIEVESSGCIQLVRDYDPSLPEFEGDTEQLIQAMLNICRNAYQALTETETQNPKICLRTRALRKITLGSEQHRILCCVEISDNGPGIAEELLSTIFYPMVTGRAEGSGLGLSIAQSIINQHQGLIECHSRPGETVFQIYIPLENKDGSDVSRLDR